MLFNGRTIKKGLGIIACCFAMSTHADFNQMAPGYGEDLTKSKPSKKKDSASHLPNTVGPSAYEIGPEQKSPSPFVHSDKKVEELTELPASYGVSSGIRAPGDGLKAGAFTEMNSREVLADVHRKGRYGYGFKYIQDQFDYKTPNEGAFQRAYQDASGSIQGGYLLFGGDRYLWRKYVDLSLVGQVGFGYNQGVGRFVDGSASQTKFRLWTLPLEVGVALSIPVGTWFSLKGSAGPSLLGIIQTRDDRPRGHSEREKRQFSPGYFAEAVLRLNLSRIFPGTGFTVFKDYQASNFYLDILMRTQSYENFKDELSITGSSLGLGFSFEFI